MRPRGRRNLCVSVQLRRIGRLALLCVRCSDHCAPFVAAAAAAAVVPLAMSIMMMIQMRAKGFGPSQRAGHTVEDTSPSSASTLMHLRTLPVLARCMMTSRRRQTAQPAPVLHQGRHGRQLRRRKGTRLPSSGLPPRTQPPPRPGVLPIRRLPLLWRLAGLPHSPLLLRLLRWQRCLPRRSHRARTRYSRRRRHSPQRRRRPEGLVRPRRLRV